MKHQKYNWLEALAALTAHSCETDFLHVIDNTSVLSATLAIFHRNNIIEILHAICDLPLILY